LAIHFVMEVAFVIIIYIIEEFFKSSIFDTILKKVIFLYKRQPDFLYFHYVCGVS